MAEIAAARIDALLRGEPALDTEERHVATIVAALRAAPAPPPERLRKRVATTVPAGSRDRVPHVSLRRGLLVLVPTAVAAVLVAAVVDGLVTSGKSERTAVGTTPTPAMPSTHATPPTSR